MTDVKVNQHLLRGVFALLDQMRPHRLDERAWHEAICQWAHQRSGCELLLSIRAKHPGGAGQGGIAAWLAKQLPAHDGPLNKADQAHLAVFLSPRCPRNIWLRHPLVRIEHCSTPLGELVAMLYHLPRSGVWRCTLLCHRSHDVQFGQVQKVLVRAAARQIMTRYALGYFDPVGSAIENLSPRELETLLLTLGGHNEAAIARQMVRSPHTIHSYIKGLYEKFRVTSKGELMALFIEQLQAKPHPMEGARRTSRSAAGLSGRSPASAPARRSRRR